MRFALVTLAAAVLGVSGAQASVGNMTSHGGPLLSSPKVYVILWLPSGRHIEPSGNDSKVAAALQNVVENLSGTHYLGVVTQYGATDQIQFGGLWVDTTAYPHAGTQGDPLQVSDYAGSVQRALTTNGWQPGLDKLYLVYTANQTEACGLSTIPSGGRDPAHLAYTPDDCTFPNSGNDQCAGHSSFLQNGRPVAYAAIPDPAAVDCSVPADGRFDPNHDVPLDTELINESMFIAAMVVDPLADGWYTGNPETGEIACFSGAYVGDLRLGGQPVPVFPLWSNATGSCATGYPALATKVTLKRKTVRRRGTQALTVKTVAGASVQLEFDYAGGDVRTHAGSAAHGVYRYTWRVPRAKGRARVLASVSTPDGGEGTARASFRIR